MKNIKKLFAFAVCTYLTHSLKPEPPLPQTPASSAPTTTPASASAQQPAKTPVQSVKPNQKPSEPAKAEENKAAAKKKAEKEKPTLAAPPAQPAATPTETPTSIPMPPPLKGPVVSSSATPIEAKAPVIPPLPPVPVNPQPVAAQPTASLSAHPLPPVKQYPIAVSDNKNKDFISFRNLLHPLNVASIITIFQNSITIASDIKMKALDWLLEQSELSPNDKIILIFKLALQEKNPEIQAQIYNKLTHLQLTKGDPILYAIAHEVQQGLPLDNFIAWYTKALHKNAQSPLAHLEVKAFEHAIDVQDVPAFTTLRRYFSIPKEQATRLLWLAVNGNKDARLIPLLKSMQADVNSVNNKQDQQTPLMIATENGNLEMVTKLLDNGADPHKKDHFGKTATDIAHDKKMQMPQDQQGKFIDIGIALDHERSLSK